MKQFLPIAIYLIPAAVTVAYWVELILTDQVALHRFPVIFAVLAGCLAWCVKDWPHSQALRPALLGCFLGSALAFLLIGPIIAAYGVHSELDALKETDPGMHAFTISSTAILPVTERHQRRGLKIALPIGFLSGLANGSMIAMFRKRSRGQDASAAL